MDGELYLWGRMSVTLFSASIICTARPQRYRSTGEDSMFVNGWQDCIVSSLQHYSAAALSALKPVQACVMGLDQFI